MAIHDILAAITQETDRRIAAAKESHRTQMSTLREESDRRLLAKKQELASQCNKKEQQMRSKTRTHLALQRRNAVLQKKQTLLEQLYGSIAEAFAKEKPAVLEKFFENCLNHIKGNGEIRPAKEHAELIGKIADKKRFTIGKAVDALGGFIFVSDTQERDYTFEHLAREQLRPHTEVAVAASLFS